MFTQDILPESIFDLCDDDQSPLALKQLELKYAKDKDEVARKDRLEREERERKDRLEHEERERKDRIEREEKEREFQLKTLEMKLKLKNGGDAETDESGNKFFDISTVVKLVPNFDESDPDEFFHCLKS